MARLGLVRGRLGASRPQRLKPPAKVADPLYQSPEHRAWAAKVISRAGGRCEAIDARGIRCTKAAPRHRMFADHVDEVRDGGARFDPDNGQCLCGSHHSAKTALARAARLTRPPPSEPNP
jgi:hypothetical protein